MKRIAIILLVLSATACTEGQKRGMKSLSSSFTGGLNRSCTVYALNGQVLKEYEGHFDLQTSERQVFFDLNGKRTIIRNATVICDEK